MDKFGIKVKQVNKLKEKFQQKFQDTAKYQNFIENHSLE